MGGSWASGANNNAVVCLKVAFSGGSEHPTFVSCSYLVSEKSCVYKNEMDIYGWVSLVPYSIMMHFHGRMCMGDTCIRSHSLTQD